ncbi:YifB family Mg chelatase-like AAA ATPase [Paenibacillus sp. YN15]|uniref:YifB family Mg chelatase-like AAA ATPase n=1 Tax=Paenibacillus sp. YN15 TaxID=1742774 RepID=UPI000DCB5342|nr:YifB family Mg chelatase-like AAA ATPase [Paenibacillus sp. YN15]RAV03452.1 ATP-binding protein [Paenibacillus sp. YN15]
MYGKLMSACVAGIDGVLVEVETDIANGLPFFQVVGLPDSAIRESTERVRAAIRNSGFTYPMERITVNLAPADVRKEGSAFDLAIAAGILEASGQIRLEDAAHTLWIGELALDGTLRPVSGVLSMVHQAARQGLKRVVLPLENAREANLVGQLEVVTVKELRELADPLVLTRSWRDMEEADEPSAAGGSADCGSAMHAGEDYADVCGQHQAKRALVIAASGKHNLLFIGPPGTGKTMLMRRLPTILPEMDDEEALEVTKIYSVAGKLTDRGQLLRLRPFRSPHHTVSPSGLAGGGSIPKPGEISLAHHGVLFLDELPEFSRLSLEAMRQPLEDRKVTIGRARATYTYPAHFLLTASMNPCPCGFFGVESATEVCTCSPLKIAQYRSRISGPLLDRIDLHVEVPRTRYEDLAFSDTDRHLSSQEMKAQVMEARRIQERRYKGSPYRYNGELSGRALRQYCRPTGEAEALLASAFQVMGLSVRAHDRVLKLARTIADLEASDEILLKHLAEALQYRKLDKKG